MTSWVDFEASAKQFIRSATPLSGDVIVKYVYEPSFDNPYSIHLAYSSDHWEWVYLSWNKLEDSKKFGLLPGLAATWQEIKPDIDRRSGQLAAVWAGPLYSKIQSLQMPVILDKKRHVIVDGAKSFLEAGNANWKSSWSWDLLPEEWQSLGELITDLHDIIVEPDNTAVRTALWRALHLEVDGKPSVIEDKMGLELVAPDKDWRQRKDMDPSFTRRLRASVVARARFIEDLLVTKAGEGISQCVMLGAGLDTFAQRRPDIAQAFDLYEIDQPDTLTWKRRRLIELGMGIPHWQHFVPVDFEKSSWWLELHKAGFDKDKPAVVVCTGVTLYLTKEAIAATLRQLAMLAAGSVVAISFYLPMDLLDEEDRFLQEIAEKGARQAGTPFLSFFSPEQTLNLGKEAGFKEVSTVATGDIEHLYFSNRADGLKPASGEVFLIAGT